MELSQKSDKEILQVINPIMDNIGQGAGEINWFKHSRDFSTVLKSKADQASFEEMLKDRSKGMHLNRELAAIYRRQHSLVAVWKQFYEKTNNEYVLEAVFIEEEGKVVVDHVIVF